jgi:hypothetical protein
MAKYQNIPVKPEIYQKVKMIAEANNRGLGDQVAHWVGRDLPECDHPKYAVNVEVSRSETLVAGETLSRTGWFCPTCKRVYQFVASEFPTQAEYDPYGQISVALVKNTVKA